jgi:ATP-binding cassette subfamily B protein
MGTICRGRTVIIIAHRLSAVQKATRILVLDKGGLVEDGSPQTLMELKGAFYRMVMAQRRNI